MMTQRPGWTATRDASGTFAPSHHTGWSGAAADHHDASDRAAQDNDGVVTITPRWPSLYSGHAVSEANFGANLLFNRDVGSGLENYTVGVQTLGVTTLRYPGGTIAESMFDLENPNGSSQRYLDKASLLDPDGPTGPLKPQTMGLSDFVSYCGDQGVSMSFVMPTVRFAGDERDGSGNRFADVDKSLVHDFVVDLLKQALAEGVTVQAIELGNEWWLDNSALFGESLSAVEYGRIASELAAVVQGAIDDFQKSHSLPSSWEEPDIVVQVGPSGDAEWVTPDGHRPPAGYTGPLVASTEIIFREFNTTAEQRAVDGIALHDYLSGDYANINGYRYNAFDAWDDLASRDPDFGEAERYVTEWNVKNGNEAMYGLKQASAMVSMMAQMMRNEVDHANVWPIQQTTNTALTHNSGMAGEAWEGLSAAGEAYRMMAESLEGLRVIPTDGASSSFQVNAFGDEERVVLFIANTTGSRLDLALDVSALTDGYTHVWGTLLTAEGNNPLDPNLEPIVTNLTADEITASGALDLSLDPYSMIRVEYTLTDAGARIDGYKRDDNLIGSAHDDRIVGKAGSDWIKGSDGRDSLFGSEGDDRVEGGSGDDDVRGDDGTDQVYGGDGSDQLYGGQGTDELRGGNGDDRLDAGNGFLADSLYGGSGDDVLKSSSGRDDQWGGQGHDHLYGGDDGDKLRGEGGNDAVFGGAGDDLSFGGSGSDSLHGGSGNDALHGQDGRDKLYGNAGHDRLRGGESNDTIYGGSGNDELHGQNQTDRLYGGSGSDVLDGDDSGDFVYGGAGWDTLRGGADCDTLFGGSEADVLGGGIQDDVLYGDQGGDDLMGGSGRDRLYGGAGRDRIDGQRGDDKLTGGGGADVFVFAEGQGADIVLDYEQGKDSLVFSGFARSWDVDDVMAHGRQSGDDVIFHFEGSSVRVSDATLLEVRNDLELA